MKSDSRLVQYASRSFYEDLLMAGVSIYEYEPRILHAKVLSIDNSWAILGSANMDTRSFRLNFELNLLIFGSQLSKPVDALFERDLGLSKRVDLAEFVKRPVTQRLIENASRLLSPVL